MTQRFEVALHPLERDIVDVKIESHPLLFDPFGRALVECYFDIVAPHGHHRSRQIAFERFSSADQHDIAAGDLRFDHSIAPETHQPQIKVTSRVSPFKP